LLCRRSSRYRSRSLQGPCRSWSSCKSYPPEPRNLKLVTDIPQVALIYTASKDAEQTASSIASENGITCKAYKSDVTDAKLIEETLKQIAKDFGKLDILVANAGIATHYAAEDYTPEQFSEVMKVNLDGAFYTAQAAARIFKVQGYGNIVFTASVSAILVNVPQKQSAVNHVVHRKLTGVLIVNSTTPRKLAWCTWRSASRSSGLISAA
jgi:hypothetical protein